MTTTRDDLNEAIDKASRLTYPMKREDIEVCEDYAMTIGDLAYKLQEELMNEIYSHGAWDR